MRGYKLNIFILRLVERILRTLGGRLNISLLRLVERVLRTWDGRRNISLLKLIGGYIGYGVAV